AAKLSTSIELTVARAAAVTATATAAATRPTIAATTAAHAGDVLTRARFVHIQRPAEEFLAVHAGNSRLRFFFRCHFNKAEAAGFARELVFDDGGTGNIAESRKSVLQILFRCLT